LTPVEVEMRQDEFHGYKSRTEAVYGTNGGKAGSLIRKHDHSKPARKMRRDVRALTARNHPEGGYWVVMGC